MLQGVRGIDAPAAVASDERTKCPDLFVYRCNQLSSSSGDATLAAYRPAAVAQHLKAHLFRNTE